MSSDKNKLPPVVPSAAQNPKPEEETDPAPHPKTHDLEERKYKLDTILAGGTFLGLLIGIATFYIQNQNTQEQIRLAKEESAAAIQLGQKQLAQAQQDSKTQQEQFNQQLIQVREDSETQQKQFEKQIAQQADQFTAQLNQQSDQFEESLAVENQKHQDNLALQREQLDIFIADFEREKGQSEQDAQRRRNEQQDQLFGELGVLLDNLMEYNKSNRGSRIKLIRNVKKHVEKSQRLFPDQQVDLTTANLASLSFSDFTFNNVNLSLANLDGITFAEDGIAATCTLKNAYHSAPDIDSCPAALQPFYDQLITDSDEYYNLLAGIYNEETKTVRETAMMFEGQYTTGNFAVMADTADASYANANLIFSSDDIITIESKPRLFSSVSPLKSNNISFVSAKASTVIEPDSGWKFFDWIRDLTNTDVFGGEAADWPNDLIYDPTNGTISTEVTDILRGEGMDWPNSYAVPSSDGDISDWFPFDSTSATANIVNTSESDGLQIFLDGRTPILTDGTNQVPISVTGPVLKTLVSQGSLPINTVGINANNAAAQAMIQNNSNGFTDVSVEILPDGTISFGSPTTLQAVDWTLQELGTRDIQR